MLGKQSWEKICSYVDIVKIALTPPVFLDTYEELFFKTKKVPQQKVFNFQN